MSKYSGQLNTAVPRPTPPAPRIRRVHDLASAAPQLTRLQALRAVPTAPHHHAVTDTVNAAGGLAFRKSNAFALITLVFNALLSKATADKYYESEAATIARLQTLVAEDPELGAKCAVFARRVLGLRSISHTVAAIVCHVTKGQGLPWVRPFVQSVVYRADDAIEITAAYFHLYAKGVSIRKASKRRGKKVPVTLPNPLKRGVADALEQLDGYALAKYKKSSAPVSLADLFNLYHPKPRPENAEAVAAFIKGELKNVDTWEARVSKAGPDKVKKEEAWCSLFEERKLGYFAMLRNLRNILEQAPGAVDHAIKFLKNKTAISKSLILPFQFLRAYREIEACGLPRAAEVALAIDEAMSIACQNIPVLPGRTLVALDESGSMGARDTDTSPAGRGSMFAAIVLKSQPGADFMAFSTNAQLQPMDTSSTLFGLTKAIRSRWQSGSTNFHAIFDTATAAYENIIIISDQEGWTLGKSWTSEMGAPTSARRRYEQRVKVLPFITVFDLAGAGEMMFPEDSVATLSGWSEKVFTLLRELRKDPAALVNEVRKIDFAAINEDDED